MQSPSNPPMAEKNWIQVWLGNVWYSMIVGVLK
jgi:hypothetical protein